MLDPHRLSYRNTVMNTKNTTFRLLFSILAVAAASVSPTGRTLAAFSNGMIMFQRLGSRAKTTKTTMAASGSAKATTVATSANTPKVAVIGAGAAGIVTARILSSKGFQPFVFEKGERDNNGIGGVWSYEPGAEDRPMYRGLRTNLPRELMAFREKKWGGDGTTMSFVTHNDVRDYLKEYVEENDLYKYISFGCEVKQLTVCIDEKTGAGDDPLADDNNILPWPKVKLEWQHGEDNSPSEVDTFDAVCICNGHYASPSSPPIEGLQHFKGKVMHSVEYDDPSIFKDQTVLCVGGRASGSDLAREISMHAKKVFLSDTSFPATEDGEDGSKRNGITMGNVVWVPKTLSFDKEDSCVEFDRLCTQRPKDIDVIIFCSGYDYEFPFINDKSNLELRVLPGERRVSPLYEQLWHAQYPNIAFVGLQHSVVPFPFFEFQAEAIANQLLKKIETLDGHIDNDSADEYQVPLSLEERINAAERDANSGGPKGTRVQDTHFLGNQQWDACKLYAKYGGILSDSIEKYINTNKLIYEDSNNSRKGLFPGGPDDYRYNSYVRDDENESFNRYPITSDNAGTVPSQDEKILLSEI